VSDPRWTLVCEPETAASLRPADCCGALANEAKSPIDDYYEYVEHLLTLGDAQALQDSDTLGRLLLLGLVSGVEGYFRSIFVGALRTCEISRRMAANQEIPFGAIDYYGVESAALGLFDSDSLASAGRIGANTKKLLGIPIPKESSLGAALREFDKVCHLRHAAVHARGALGRGNAFALGLAARERLGLELRLPALHSAGLVCHSVVRSYNRFLYREMIERWLAEGVLSGDWAIDRATFHPLFELFQSRVDGVGPMNAYQAHRSLAVSIVSL
jgi:hypothetical protein